jgi:hypothetical protein
VEFKPSSPPPPPVLSAPSPTVPNSSVSDSIGRTLASVNAPDEQRLWHYTLDLMEADTSITTSTSIDHLRRVRSWITDGVTLDFVSDPACIDHVNTPSVVLNSDLVRRRIAEYRDFCALIPLPNDHPTPFGVQPLHVIIKPPRKPRIVVDLSRNLNDHLRYEYFHYSNISDAVDLSFHGCWYSKLDLSNCFLSFPLHPSALPHFLFRFEGQLYQFTRMPFGLSTAPRICTELLSVVAYYLRLHGVDALVRYLDDFLFINKDEASGQLALALAQRTFDAFGLVVNPDKTEGPAQRLTFLGIAFDSIACTLSCTRERVDELLTLLADAVKGSRVELTALATLIGKLQFASQVLPGFRPFIHGMQALYNSRESSVRHTNGTDRHRHFTLQHSKVKTSVDFRGDVRFWLVHLPRWNGIARWRTTQSDPFVFASDASLQGFGFYLESLPHHTDPTLWHCSLQLGSGFVGVYSPCDSTYHRESGQINWCEVFAMYAALSTYRTVLRDCCVVFYCDNSTGVHILNRQSTRAFGLAPLLRDIFLLCLECNITLRAVHRPGVENVLADFLSRPRYHGPASHPVEEWRVAHPNDAHRLCSVSVVYSHQFGNKRVPLTTRPSSRIGTLRTR